MAGKAVKAKCNLLLGHEHKRCKSAQDTTHVFVVESSHKCFCDTRIPHTIVTPDKMALQLFFSAQRHKETKISEAKPRERE